MSNWFSRIAPVALTIAIPLAAPTVATAQIEVEADPIAYALHGFSLHAAKIVGPTRLNVGVFGADVPAFFHGNEGWDQSMRGAGVKWDYVGGSPDGVFVGLESGWMRSEYTLLGETASVRRNVIGVGVRGGYRLPVGGRGLYVAPWVGVSYNFDGDDVAVGGAAFDRSPVTIFPTVHIGWRF